MNEKILMMRSAKAKLTGLWAEAAIGSLIYIALTALASSTSLLEIVVYGPLTFGYYLFMACLVDRKENNLNLLFQGFNRFVETLVAGLLLTVAVSIGLILLVVPGIILACGFAMTFYIMIDDPNISGLDALKQSWNMMQGRKWDFFCLQLRFLGWIILSIITCGIGYIWLSPYMTITNLNFYRKIRYNTF